MLAHSGALNTPTRRHALPRTGSACVTERRGQRSTLWLSGSLSGERGGEHRAHRLRAVIIELGMQRHRIVLHAFLVEHEAAVEHRLPDVHPVQEQVHIRVAHMDPEGVRVVQRHRHPRRNTALGSGSPTSTFVMPLKVTSS